MDASIYKGRRSQVMNQMGSGVIFLAGNHAAPRNYQANTFPFRQDSTFLYYLGLRKPGMYCILDCDNGTEYLAGTESGIEDTIWMGAQPSLAEMAQQAGIDKTILLEQLPDFIKKIQDKGRTIHFLPPYTGSRKIALSDLINIPVNSIEQHISVKLRSAVIQQRLVKTEIEIDEIERTITEVTAPMHVMAMRMAVEGVYEFEIVAEMQKVAALNNSEMAYPPICSVRGEVLHNLSYQNKLQHGDLLLVDAGVESSHGYATDITRTIPVGGMFSTQQMELYRLVLSMQQHAIQAIKPGVKYSDIHMLAAETLVKGLVELNIMKGDAREAVHAGAHALFFMHGLGHMLGLDVHDMEDLGTDNVGYNDDQKPSKQFGTANLRLAKELEPGNVLTVEPGIYFNMVLVALWEKEKRFANYINYSVLNKYNGFGGIRIEDNVLITNSGCRILGKPIPKQVGDIEEITQQGLKSD